MAENPITLTVPLSSSNAYCLKIDTNSADCRKERPHWHLCLHGSRVGQIYTDGVWKMKLHDIRPTILREAEDLTKRYLNDIESTYIHNRENGAR